MSDIRLNYHKTQALLGIDYNISHFKGCKETFPNIVAKYKKPDIIRVSINVSIRASINVSIGASIGASIRASIKTELLKLR